MKFATEIGSAYDVANMFDLIMFGAGRDIFQYTRIEAAKLLTDLTPRLTDCHQLRELIEAVATQRAAAFGSSQFVPDALLQALHIREADVCLPR